MSDNTLIKIQGVLNDLIDKYKLVFWYDKEGEMKEFVSSLDIPGVEILTLQNNAFSVKYRISNSPFTPCSFL